MNPPTASTVTKNSIQVSFVSVTTSPENRGTDVDTYDIQYKRTADPTFTEVLGVTSPYTITTLDVDTVYEIQVRAVNIHGNGGWSTSLSQTTYNVPEAPVSVTVALSTDELGVDISWTAPA